MNENTAKYRFDNAYSTVYNYNQSSNAYIYLCSYLQAGIRANMRESTKIKLTNDYIANC